MRFALSFATAISWHHNSSRRKLGSAVKVYKLALKTKSGRGAAKLYREGARALRPFSPYFLAFHVTDILVANDIWCFYRVALVSRNSACLVWITSHVNLFDAGTS
jgi:hypothetical protein